MDWMDEDDEINWTGPMDWMERMNWMWDVATTVMTAVVTAGWRAKMSRILSTSGMARVDKRWGRIS